MPARSLALLALAAGLFAVAGCSGAVEVLPTAPTGQSLRACTGLVGDLPDTVAGQSDRRVDPDDALAAAWGDPAIVLRCGVHRPAGLRRDSPCAVVNDVGWFARETSSGYVFTTIGRSTYVEVTVPDDYAPEADALVDVADAVTAHIPAVQPCQ